MIINLNGRHYRKTDRGWERFRAEDSESLFPIIDTLFIDALEEIARLREVIGTYDLALQRATWRL